MRHAQLFGTRSASKQGRQRLHEQDRQLGSGRHTLHLPQRLSALRRREQPETCGESDKKRRLRFSRRVLVSRVPRRQRRDQAPALHGSGATSDARGDTRARVDQERRGDAEESSCAHVSDEREHDHKRRLVIAHDKRVVRDRDDDDDDDQMPKNSSSNNNNSKKLKQSSDSTDKSV